MKNKSKKTKIKQVNAAAKLQKKGIKQRLMESYGIVITLSVVASIVALIILQIIGSQISKFYNENYHVTMETWDARYTQLSARSALLTAMVDEDVKVTKQQIEAATEYLEEMGNILEDMKTTYTGDVSTIEKIDADRLEAMSYVKDMLNNAVFGQHAKAYAIMKESYAPRVDEIARLLEEVAVEEEQSALSKVSFANKLLVIAIVVIIVILVICIVVAMRLGIKIARGISAPVGEIEGAAKRLSEGDLSADISYKSEDELGRLAESMRASCEFMKEVITDTDYLLHEIATGNFRVESDHEDVYIGDFKGLLASICQLKEQLSGTLLEINEASSQVAVGAEQMAQGAQALAEGATDQAGAVQELTAMVNGVSELAQKTVVTTKESYSQAMQFKQEVENGQREMGNLLTAMERIRETSKQIEKIIAEIEDIASQTNLLSLNASIEAARAGEAGRGFAVVADQIGKLAADSAQSSVNTKKMIQEALEEIEKGNEITNRTSETLGKVSAGIDMLADSVQEVNGRAADQAESIGQVEIGIEQISTVIESNSAAAEQTSATSQELSAQADRLKGLVGQFTL
ncbi:MAG: methyl-accepting chemotaxis protein [Acetatifactor sp.]